MENVKHVLTNLYQTMIIRYVYARAHKLFLTDSAKIVLLIKRIRTSDFNRQYLQMKHKHGANVNGMVLNLTALMNAIVIME